MSETKYTKKVTIREIVQFFKFEQLTGDDHALDRWTVVPDINRPGFELCRISVGVNSRCTVEPISSGAT